MEEDPNHKTRPPPRLAAVQSGSFSSLIATGCYEFHIGNDYGCAVLPPMNPNVHQERKRRSSRNKKRKRSSTSKLTDSTDLPKTSKKAGNKRQKYEYAT